MEVKEDLEKQREEFRKRHGSYDKWAQFKYRWWKKEDKPQVPDFGGADKPFKWPVVNPTGNVTVPMMDQDDRLKIRIDPIRQHRRLAETRGSNGRCNDLFLFDLYGLFDDDRFFDHLFLFDLYGLFDDDRLGLASDGDCSDRCRGAHAQKCAARYLLLTHLDLL